MSHDSSIFSLLSLVESIDKITTSAVAQRVGKCEISAWNRGIMIRIEGLLKHASSEFAKLMNDCRTINRIPPEILLLIFSFAGRGAPVLKISHVCKWWRQLAVSSATLWTLYSTKHFPRLDMTLQRSRNALLDIRIHSLDEQTIQSLLPLRFQIGRLRTFSVVFTPSQYSRVAASLVEMFSSAAVNLTRLSLSIAQRHGDVISGGTDSCFTSLFGGVMPRLRILHLNHVDIWPQCSGPALQYLVLMNTTLPILSLLSSLKYLPCLEVLVLDSVSFSGALHSPEDIAMMEHLCVLHVRTTIKTKNDSILLYHLLSSLATQAGFSVHLDVTNCSTIVQRTLKQGARPRNYFGEGIHSLYLGEKITASDSRSLITYNPISSADLKVTPDSGILFGYFYCSLAHVTHLVLDRRTSKYNTDWHTILGSVPSLESLAFLCYESRDSAVYNVLLEADPITHIPRYALRLEEITISPRPSPYHMSDDPKPLILELIPLLKTRRASGYPLKRVKLFPWEVLLRDIDRIEECVPEVIRLRDKGLPEHALKLQIPPHLAEVEPENISSGYFDF